MSEIPDTRQSLIQRVKDAEDTAAWSEFASIYRPAVFRFALRRGLQQSDAEDVAQRVFVAVARSMKDWEASEDRGSFRAWLLRVTKNHVINALTRQPKAIAKGGTSTLLKLSELPGSDSLSKELEWEYRRAEFRRAARDVEAEFDPSTWQAFWQTAVEEKTIPEVATALGKSTGSVYAARSRVLKRLKQRVEQLTHQQGHAK